MAMAVAGAGAAEGLDAMQRCCAQRSALNKTRPWSVRVNAFSWHFVQQERTWEHLDMGQVDE